MSKQLTLRDYRNKTKALFDAVKAETPMVKTDKDFEITKPSFPSTANLNEKLQLAEMKMERMAVAIDQILLFLGDKFPDEIGLSDAEKAAIDVEVDEEIDLECDEEL